jgi:hypothetical protein
MMSKRLVLVSVPLVMSFVVAACASAGVSTTETALSTRDTSTLQNAFSGHWSAGESDMYVGPDLIFVVGEGYPRKDSWTVAKQDPAARRMTIHRKILEGYSSLELENDITFSADYGSVVTGLPGESDVLGIKWVYVDGETAPSEWPNTTSTSVSPVVVLLDFTVTHSGDHLVLAGKVKNEGSAPLTFVEIRGTALAASGEIVNTNTAYIDSDVLAPGATATYTVYVDDPNREATQGRVQIEDYSTL